MASAVHSTPAAAQQPGLRSFIVCDLLPLGCTAHLVTNDDNAPHLRAGDIAIIDPTDCDPEIGELFAIEWEGGRRDIVETWTRPTRAGCGPNGEFVDTVCWYVAGYNRARSNEDAMNRLNCGAPVGWVNGPYATEGPRAGSLGKKLRGKVVGILEPITAGPMKMLV